MSDFWGASWGDRGRETLLGFEVMSSGKNLLWVSSFPGRRILEWLQVKLNNYWIYHENWNTTAQNHLCVRKTLFRKNILVDRSNCFPFRLKIWATLRETHFITPSSNCSHSWLRHTWLVLLQLSTLKRLFHLCLYQNALFPDISSLSSFFPRIPLDMHLEL